METKDMGIKKIKVRITLLEEMLGTASANPEIHSEFIASKAPDAPSMEEEVAAIGAEAVEQKQMTVFPRDDDGNPIMWDYQFKGLMKDACQMLRKVGGSASSKIKAYKKEIDGLIFAEPRMIRLDMHGGKMGVCQRPLRAQTPQGERVALASSETVPAGTTMDVTFVLYSPSSHRDALMEWLDYGAVRGMGQWRNSGKGRFSYQVVAEE